MHKLATIILMLGALLTPDYPAPQIEVPQCAYGGVTNVAVSWQLPGETLESISAVVYLYEVVHGQEVVRFMDYAGQVSGAHTWRAALPNPYPAHWKVFVSMYAGDRPVTVTNQNRPGGCGLFLPIAIR